VAFAARSDKSRTGKPRIRIARSVKVVVPRSGDLMYRENLWARKQGAGYLLTDGDAIDGASGGVLVASHADGRKLAVGVFKGFVVKGANFKGRDHVGRFDPQRRANLIVTIPINTAERISALIAKYLSRFAKNLAAKNTKNYGTKGREPGRFARHAADAIGCRPKWENWHDREIFIVVRRAYRSWRSGAGYDAGE
jgi:hypothetical protein